MNLAHFYLGIYLFNVLLIVSIVVISLINLSMYSLVNRLINLTGSLYIIYCFCLSLLLR